MNITYLNKHNTLYRSGLAFLSLFTVITYPISAKALDCKTTTDTEVIDPKNFPPEINTTLTINGKWKTGTYTTRYQPGIPPLSINLTNQNPTLNQTVLSNKFRLSDIPTNQQQSYIDSLVSAGSASIEFRFTDGTNETKCISRQIIQGDKYHGVAEIQSKSGITVNDSSELTLQGLTGAEGFPNLFDINSGIKTTLCSDKISNPDCNKAAIIKSQLSQGLAIREISLINGTILCSARLSDSCRLISSSLTSIDKCGDFDRDGDVDSVDLNNFLGLWTGTLATGAATHNFTTGDCDGDGDVDSGDMLDMVGNWTGAR